MLSEYERRVVEEATVTIVGKGARGVLIDNCFVLTAAHCIDIDYKGGMALTKYYEEEIETIHGERQKLDIRFVDPVLDLAVLGGADDEGGTENSYTIWSFWEKVLERVEAPLSLFLGELAVMRDPPIHIYTYEGTWITGTAHVPDRSNFFYIQTSGPIKSRASGSPIVNDACELIGIVSYIGESEEKDYFGKSPYLPNSLPFWVVKQFRSNYDDK